MTRVMGGCGRSSAPMTPQPHQAPPASCFDCRLRQMQCFLPVTSEELAFIQSCRGSVQAVRAGRPIVTEDRAPDRLFTLYAGWAFRYKSLPDGRRQIIDMVGPGRLLGVGVGERNRCSADTLSYVTLEPATEIDHPDLEQALEEMVLRAQSHATLLGRKNAPERVASAILDLADQFVRPSRSKRETICFNLHPTRGELADWLGLTVETVSRCFTRLKRAGLIEFRHPEIVTLLQPQALADIAAGNRAIDNANAA